MSKTTVDPYAVLGIPRGADQRQVRRAYRRLAKRYHPDLHPDITTTVGMQRVNEAWEILSNPARRAAYDAESRGSAPSFGHWSVARRAAPAGSGSTTWSGGWASPRPVPPAHSSAGSRRYDDGEGPSWPGVFVAITIGLVAFIAVLAGILPFPLFGIALLVLLRGTFGRFGDRGDR